MSMNSALIGKRLLLRHDVTVGCIGSRHVIPVTVLRCIADSAASGCCWYIVMPDHAVSDSIWRTGQMETGSRQRNLLLIRSRWKGFEVGDRWPVMVDVNVVSRLAQDSQGDRHVVRGVELAKCLCFSESSMPLYEDQLIGTWHGAPPVGAIFGRLANSP
jgi:hypothetical protein